ncbi:Myotubularin Phosphatidylinositol-3,5-bisphosphate 3-phosphatase [Pelomyxa schiedti]|nr:Myotubularin Phosphatidylinositol-3,5-bisphosphate 3-phosphatase [Pelomyxa schiedti]
MFGFNALFGRRSLPSPAASPSPQPSSAPRPFGEPTSCPSPTPVPAAAAAASCFSVYKHDQNNKCTCTTDRLISDYTNNYESHNDELAALQSEVPRLRLRTKELEDENRSLREHVQCLEKELDAIRQRLPNPAPYAKGAPPPTEPPREGGIGIGLRCGVVSATAMATVDVIIVSQEVTTRGEGRQQQQVAASAARSLTAAESGSGTMARGSLPHCTSLGASPLGASPVNYLQVPTASRSIQVPRAHPGNYEPDTAASWNAKVAENFVERFKQEVHQEGTPPHKPEEHEATPPPQNSMSSSVFDFVEITGEIPDINASLKAQLMDGEVLLEQANLLQFSDDTGKFEDIPEPHAYVSNNRLIITNPSFEIKDSVVMHNIFELSCVGARLEIACKDFRQITLIFMEDDSQALSLISRLAQFHDYPQPLRFASEYKRALEVTGPVLGWNVYTPLEEFTRQQLDLTYWRVSNVNSDYRVCNTYPSVLVVPATVTDVNLKECAPLRGKSRLPALSWFNRFNKNKAAIIRCSQPLGGIWGQLGMASNDSRYIEAIRNTNLELHLVIIDARDRWSAVGNRVMGAGYESFNFCSVQFQKIPNIHKMQESWCELFTLCHTRGVTSSTLSSCTWLKHVKLLLSGADNIAQRVDSGETVICHCSDGWDRTSQLVSLAMLLLDPFYRTMHGFAVLIEKEWVSFGHLFGTRSGMHLIAKPCDPHNKRSGNTITQSLPPQFELLEEDTSPIFFQFLHAVWQLSKYFPAVFEFNSRFLELIADATHTWQWGTFLCDSELQRKTINIPCLTVSLWDHIRSFTTHSHLMNPFYTPTESPLTHIDLTDVQLWDEYIFRHCSPPRTENASTITTSSSSFPLMFS